MPHATLDIPVFDADNHLYETREAFTKFLGDEQKRVGDVLASVGLVK